MARTQNKLVSALPALTPNLVNDRTTGEILDNGIFHAELEQLVTTIQTASQEYYNNNKEVIEAALATYTGVPQPEAYARQHGWNLANNLPKPVKAQSRVERLARYHLVQTVSSYVLNPSPNKPEPTFSKNITLGAIDSQMASMTRDGNQLVLRFKCWTREFDLHFTLPAYILERDIIKISLPTIRLDKTKGWVFNFTIQEQPEIRPVGKHTAGVDLGRVEAFTLVVINKSGNRIANYTGNGRLKHINQRREKLLTEKKYLARKIGAYTELGLDTTILSKERDFKRGKITRLGVEIAKQVGSQITTQLAKHNVSVLHIEDLRWVTGVKYGSKWNHSHQQEALTHALKRKGVATKRVNSKNTSQECYKCGTILVHNTGKRTVYCVECKTRLDRDFNAAMNIARNKNKNVSPPITGGVGVTVALGQVMTHKVSNSVLSETILSTYPISVKNTT